MIKTSVRSNILTLYLALGSIVWFANFTLGSFKAILLILIILLHLPLFSKKSAYVNLTLFIFFITLVSISFQLKTNDNYLTSKFSLYYTYFLNYFFYLLGYYYCRHNLIGRVSFRKIVYTVFPLCLLTIVNLFFNFPDWHAPNVIEHFDKMESLGYQAELTQLYSSGFGLGRTGWATSLLQYLPLCLFFSFQEKNNRMFGYISFIIILFSIMISGSRGGFFYAILLTILIIIKTKSSRKVFLIFILLTLLFSILLNSLDFISFYRLDSGDVTSGRGLQYLLIPEMVSQAGLFGLGIDGSYLFSRNYLIEHALHNVYARLLIDYGWILGGGLIIMIIIIFFRTLKILFFIPYKGNEVLYIATFVIIGGLLAGITEPGAIFEARSWWVIWWFELGIFSYKYKNIKFNKHENSNNNH